MSSIAKLIAKLLTRPPEVSFQEIEKILEHFGYSKRHSGTGSHRVFTKSGELPVIVPTIKGRKVKRAYIQMIINRLELEDYHEPQE